MEEHWLFALFKSFYRKKKSIVIFIYAYDLLCESPIQELSMHNKTKNIDYDDMLIYRVSLAKIPEASKIEVERALKLLSEIELDNYLNDDSTIIKEAANMLVHYDKSEEAARITSLPASMYYNNK